MGSLSVVARALAAKLAPLADRLAFWHGYENLLRTLVILTVGLAAYSAVVFAFYLNLSRRDIFARRFAHATTWWKRALAALEYVFLFPVTSFAFFAVLSLSLFVLAKTETTGQILLVSMSVVAGVRLTAYVSEHMSEDLAKLVPLGLLGVVLVDPGYLSWATPVARVREVLAMPDVVARYFLVLLLLELTLRVSRATVERVRRAWTARRARRLTPSAPQAQAQTRAAVAPAPIPAKPR